MTYPEQYTPGPASGAQVRKDGDKWTLILVRELRHSPEKVWQALTDPAQLREWAPFVVDGNLGTVGTTVNLTWVGRPSSRSDNNRHARRRPQVLEYGDMRWELEPLGNGTRLTLWHNIDRRFIVVGRRGLAHLLRRSGSAAQRNADRPHRRRRGHEFPGWQRLVIEYSRQFGIEPPNRPPQVAQEP